MARASATERNTARLFMPVPALLKPEYPDHAALARMLSDVFYIVGRRSHVCWIVRDHVAGKQVPVATDSRVYGDVLLAVRRAIGDRIADDARADLELGKH